MPIPLSKPEILERIEAACRRHGSTLSFRRFCPDVNSAVDAPQDVDTEKKYFSWLVTTGIWRALVEEPEFQKNFCKFLKLEKNILKTQKDLRKEMGDANEPLRDYFKQFVE